MKRLLALVLLFSVGVSIVSHEQAVASARHPHATYALRKAHGRCRAHFVKRTRRHRVKGKMVRYVACVYVAPNTPALIATTTAPTGNTGTSTSVTVTTVAAPGEPAKSYSYKATIDPSFTQGISPFAVTYSYSADATITSSGQTVDASQTGQLPNGTLNLYSNGLLECSMAVGGSTDGGTCPVNYSSLGNKTVVVTYDAAGSTDATETQTVTISQFSPTVGTGTPTIGSETVDNSDNYAVNVTIPVTVSGSGATPSGTVSATGWTCGTLSGGQASCSRQVENATDVSTLTASFAYSGDGNYSSGGSSGTASIPAAPAPTVTNANTEVQCAESGGFCSEYNSSAETTDADANVYAGPMNADQSPQVGTVTFTSSDHLTICTATVYSAADLPSNNARCTNTTEHSQFSGPETVTYSGGTLKQGDAYETVYASSSTTGGSN